MVIIIQKVLIKDITTQGSNKINGYYSASMNFIMSE